MTNYSVSIFYLVKFETFNLLTPLILKQISYLNPNASFHMNPADRRTKMIWPIFKVVANYNHPKEWDISVILLTRFFSPERIHSPVPHPWIHSDEQKSQIFYVHVFIRLYYL